MTKKIVAMPMIPGQIRRGIQIRSGLGYAKYGEATWRWWCERHGIDFVVLDKPLGGDGYAQMPPTFQRWFAPELLICEHGTDARVALVDADTMIRWDAPDFFEEAQGFAAVRGESGAWIARSIEAFQHLFPWTSLVWSESFNAGFVVLGHAQLAVIRAFLEFSLSNWRKLSAIMLSGDFGTDQTPLNLMVRRQNEPVHFLPPAFNVLHCFSADPMLKRVEQSPSVEQNVFADKVLSRPGAFDFLDSGYVWHFNSVHGLRSMVMRETWRRVRSNYPGATVHQDP